MQIGTHVKFYTYLIRSIITLCIIGIYVNLVPIKRQACAPDSPGARGIIANRTNSHMNQPFAFLNNLGPR